MVAGGAAVAGDEPEENGCDGADEKSPDEVSVKGAFAEEAARTDDAPEDAAVKVDTRNGAGEAVDGFGRADARDIDEHPVEDGDLGDAGDEGGGHLDGEEELGRDFHVVAEFEVGGELDALGGADVAVGDEDHVGDWAAGEDDAADELGDEIEATVLVGDCHDDSDWDEHDAGDSEGEE